MPSGSIRKPASMLAILGCVVAGIALFLQPGVSAEPRDANLETLGERYATEVRPLVASTARNATRPNGPKPTST